MGHKRPCWFESSREHQGAEKLILYIIENGGKTAELPSGKAVVCKTTMRGFDSLLGLHIARVAKLVDAPDSESGPLKWGWRFDSSHEHHID